MPPARPAIALLALLAGCAGFDPPMAGDHGTVRYHNDLERCRKQADAKATRVANATPQSQVRAWFASDDPERQEVTDCMKARGYALR